MKFLIVILCLILLLAYLPIMLYISTLVSGIQVSFIDLVKFRIKKIPAHKLIEWHKDLLLNNVDNNINRLAQLYNEGIDLDNVVTGIKNAKENKLPIDFEVACNADRNNIDIRRTIIKTINNVDKEK